MRFFDYLQFERSFLPNYCATKLRLRNIRRSKPNFCEPKVRVCIRKTKKKKIREKTVTLKEHRRRVSMKRRLSSEINLTVRREYTSAAIIVLSVVALARAIFHAFDINDTRKRTAWRDARERDKHLVVISSSLPPCDYPDINLHPRAFTMLLLYRLRRV